MKNTDQKPQQDITEQHYRGPTALAAGLGEGAVHGKTLLVGGFLLGAISSMIWPHKVKNIAQNATASVEVMRESKNFLVKCVGVIFQTALGFGKELGTAVTETKFIKKHLDKLDKERVAMTVESAIVTSSALSIVGGITGMFAGTKASHRGRQQFEQAKSEIIDLRTKNTELRDKLIETKFALEDFKTIEAAKHGTLTVAKDPAPQPGTPTPVINTAQASLFEPVHAGVDVSRAN